MGQQVYNSFGIKRSLAYTHCKSSFKITKVKCFSPTGDRYEPRTGRHRRFSTPLPRPTTRHQARRMLPRPRRLTATGITDHLRVTCPNGQVGPPHRDARGSAAQLSSDGYVCPLREHGAQVRLVLTSGWLDKQQLPSGYRRQPEPAGCDFSRVPLNGIISRLRGTGGGSAGTPAPLHS